MFSCSPLPYVYTVTVFLIICNYFHHRHHFINMQMAMMIAMITTRITMKIMMMMVI